MARPKKKKVKSNVNKAIKEKGLVEIVEEEITFMCPKRGLVRQKVKIKRFKPFFVDRTEAVGTSDATAVIDSMDNGLDMYDAPDETGETKE